MTTEELASAIGALTAAVLGIVKGLSALRDHDLAKAKEQARQELLQEQEKAMEAERQRQMLEEMAKFNAELRDTVERLSALSPLPPGGDE